MTTNEFDCRACGASPVEVLPEFERLPRVTSDCKPFPKGGRLAVCLGCGAVQKPADGRWQAETAAIYRDYDIYFQSLGVEQAVFDPGKGFPRRRSIVLLERVVAAHPLGPTGTVIDVGCGKGAFLAAFAEFQPQWRLFGHELSTDSAEVLSRISNFQRLYTGPLQDLPGAFDLVTMIHSLEHFAEPFEGLNDLRPKLSGDGCLVIEVPNAEVSPFDLLIADHASHFTRDDLARLMSRAGYSGVLISDHWLTKELSVVAHVEGSLAAAPTPTPERAMRRVKAHIAWLERVLNAAKECRKRRRRFGIFGTSIAAMWLFGEVGDDIDFFVDEDPNRLGTLHGRSVLSPSQVPDGAVVYMPLIPEVARAVAQRLSRSQIEFVWPNAI